MTKFFVEQVRTTVIKSIVTSENASLALAKARTDGHGQVIPFEVTEETTFSVERYEEEK